MLKLLLPMLLPLLVAPLTVLVGRLILNMNAAVQALHPTVKQGVVVVIATALTALGSTLGVELFPAGTVPSLENLDVTALVSAVLAFAGHNALKGKGK